MAKRQLGNDPFLRTTAASVAIDESAISALLYTQGPRADNDSKPSGEEKVNQPHSSPSTKEEKISETVSFHSFPEPAQAGPLENSTPSQRRLFNVTQGAQEHLVKLKDMLQRILLFRLVTSMDDGMDALPVAPVIYVANQSPGLPYFGPFLIEAIRRNSNQSSPPQWLASPHAFQSPFAASLLRAFGAKPGNHEEAIRILRTNHSLVFFPEGTFVSRPSSDEFIPPRGFGKGGFLKVAIRAGCDLVPVGISVVEASSGLPLMGTVRVRFGKPIDCQHYQEAIPNAETLMQINSRIRDTVMRLADEIDDVH